ncbi:hypothetical protein [Humibacter albus]|uniref:hypothetical protein n=1 Tax=Humibacter albus TaxID=427754 RepID=UPI0003B5FA34|nr:hypothetical protein [Humibacter albus]
MIRTMPPPFAVWDIVVSVVVWMLTAAFIAVAAFFALVSLVYVDDCGPLSCSAAPAFSCLFAAGMASVVAAVTGFIWGLVRMLNRRLSWAITVGAFALCVACWAVGFVAAAHSMGH